MAEQLQLTQFPDLPVDLAQACEQAIRATRLAMQAGYRRLLIEILAPDIKPEVLSRPFLELLQPPALVLFSDAGGAALAQREWGSLPEGIELQSLTSRTQPTPEQSLLLVMPAVYSLDQVERVCQAVSGGDPSGLASKGRDPKPVLLLNPQLQDAATVGGGSGRSPTAPAVSEHLRDQLLPALIGGGGPVSGLSGSLERVAAGRARPLQRLEDFYCPAHRRGSGRTVQGQQGKGSLVELAALAGIPVRVRISWGERPGVRVSTISNSFNKDYKAPRLISISVI